MDNMYLFILTNLLVVNQAQDIPAELFRHLPS